MVIRDYLLQNTDKGGKGMKKITILLIALMVISVGFLSGCEELTTNVETIEIDGMGVTQTINYLDKPVRLEVNGMNCVITVTKETNLTEVEIDGMNSIVRVSRSHSFTSEINGMGAMIEYYD